MLKEFIILRKITLFILPFIILYAFYIQINGEVSPGGGFQAGVIFASSIIAFDLISDKNDIKRIFSINILTLCSILGVAIYSSIGVISLIFNDNYLNYSSIATDKILGQHIGIFTIELGVGITVAAVMCLIYFCLGNNN